MRRVCIHRRGARERYKGKANVEWIVCKKCLAECDTLEFGSDAWMVRLGELPRIDKNGELYWINK